MAKEILQELNSMKAMLSELCSTEKKEIYPFKEAARYLDISESFLYKKTSQGAIAHFKPENKKIYFLRADLEKYLLRNRVRTADEIETSAATILTLKGGSR